MITKEAVDMIKHFEGLRLTPYMCSANVPTIGYGSTFYEDGRRVTLQDPPITIERAESLLQFTLNRDFVPSALRLCPTLVAHKNKLGAIVSFVYNLGAGRLQSSTLRRKINAELWEEAADQLLLWNKGGGKVLRGLDLRRKAERALFLG
jgi:lysozyme